MSIGGGGPMFVAFLALIVFTAWRVAAGRSRRGPDALLAGLVWCSFLIIAYAVVLSFFRRLAPGGMTLLAALGAASAQLVPRRTRPDPPADPASWSSREAVGLAVVLFPPIAFLLGSLFIALRAPETGWDNLGYHLPRLGYWIQHGEVSAFLANNPRIGSFPPNGNVLQLVPALFLRHDRLCGAVQLVAMAATGLGIYATARALEASRAAGLFAVLGWFTVPSAAVQASLTMVDVTASFFVSAAVYFLARRPRDVFHVFTSLLATGLAVGTKQHLLVIGIPLAAAAGAVLVLRHRSVLPLAAPALLAAALLAGGAFALQNWSVWGHPAGLPSVRWIVVLPGLASFVKNLELLLVPLVSWWPGAPAWAYSAKETLTGEGFGLYWIVVAGASCALLAWDQRRARDPRWLALAGLGLGGTLVLLALLRHQQAVYRFVLPVATTLTVLHARTFDRLGNARAWRRGALLGLAWLTAIWVLGCHGYWNLARRRSGDTWITETQRYGSDLEPLAKEVRRRSQARPLRVGLVSGQYFFEGLFFGRRYRNTVVPLSYGVPGSRSEVDALGLDMLWITAAWGCHADLFQREFRSPPPVRTLSWTPATRAFDDDFLDAHGAVTDMVDARPLVRSLTESGSPWGVVVRNRSGALFVRGDGRSVGLDALCGPPPR